MSSSAGAQDETQKQDQGENAANDQNPDLQNQGV